MTKFSANLGFLWKELPLIDAIRAAKKAGFDAVECHNPYDTPADAVKSVLQETGFEMLGINTLTEGANGLAAICGQEEGARAAIDQAVAYGSQIGVRHIHVLAGTAQGEDAYQCFVGNLRYAAEQAQQHGINIVIEPLNPKDALGYFLNSTYQAAEIISEINVPNLKLMFDCYHMQLIEGNLTNRLSALLPIIGHIQFASVPDRGAPHLGEVNYKYVFDCLHEYGWTAPLGAEYRPSSETESSLEWLTRF